MSGAGYDVVVDVDEEVSRDPFQYINSSALLDLSSWTTGWSWAHWPPRGPRIPLLKLQHRPFFDLPQATWCFLRLTCSCDSWQWLLKTLPMVTLLLRAILRCWYQLCVSKMLGSFVSASKFPRCFRRKPGSLWAVLDCNYGCVHSVLRGNNQSILGWEDWRALCVWLQTAEW